MNGEELKKFITEEVKKQEIRLLSEQEDTLPGTKPRKTVDPAEAPTKISNQPLPGPPIASSEEGGEMVELVGEEAKAFAEAYEVLMNLDLKLTKPQANVDPKIIELIAQAKRTLSAVPLERKGTASVAPDWSWRGSHEKMDVDDESLPDLPDAATTRDPLKGTRRTRDTGPNWSSADMTPEEKDEFQRTRKLPDRFGVEGDGSEDSTLPGKRI